MTPENKGFGKVMNFCNKCKKMTVHKARIVTGCLNCTNNSPQTDKGRKHSESNNLASGVQPNSPEDTPEERVARLSSCARQDASGTDICDDCGYYKIEHGYGIIGVCKKFKRKK